MGVTVRCFCHVKSGFPDEIADILDNHRCEFYDDPEGRKYQYYVIEFPPHYVLSSREIFRRAGAGDGRLKLARDDECKILPFLLDEDGMLPLQREMV